MCPNCKNLLPGWLCDSCGALKEVSICDGEMVGRGLCGTSYPMEVFNYIMDNCGRRIGHVGPCGPGAHEVCGCLCGSLAGIRLYCTKPLGHNDACAGQPQVSIRCEERHPEIRTQCIHTSGHGGLHETSEPPDSGIMTWVNVQPAENGGVLMPPMRPLPRVSERCNCRLIERTEAGHRRTTFCLLPAMHAGNHACGSEIWENTPCPDRFCNQPLDHIGEHRLRVIQPPTEFCHAEHTNQEDGTTSFCPLIFGHDGTHFWPRRYEPM